MVHSFYFCTIMATLFPIHNASNSNSSNSSNKSAARLLLVVMCTVNSAQFKVAYFSEGVDFNEEETGGWKFVTVAINGPFVGKEVASVNNLQLYIEHVLLPRHCIHQQESDGAR